jgi:hypothetical protein
MCSKVSAPGTPSSRVVVESRTKSYPIRSRANRVIQLDANGKKKVVHIDDPGGVGEQTVREIVVCSDCAARFLRETG